MERQYVHLSATIDMAKIVASRKNGPYALLQINAQEAHRGGVYFYKEDNNIWLAEPVSPQYIKYLETDETI